jgi:DNA (cytosine-5)-methyltransferase 1
MAQHNTDMVGHHAETPVSTIVGKGCTQALVTSHMVKLRGTEDSHIDSSSASVEEPVSTISAGGTHIGEVRAFLVKYFKTGAIGQVVDEPLHTVTAKHRFGLVTVHGVDYQIVDIGMRMLTPRELFRAQGFPAGYVIDLEVNGRPLPKYAQVRCCGNSVCPPLAEALVRANYTPATVMREAAE